MSGRFVVAQVISLAASAALLLWLARDGRLDFAVSALVFDASRGDFPLRTHPWVVALGHDGLRWLSLATWLVVAVLAGVERLGGSVRERDRCGVERDSRAVSPGRLAPWCGRVANWQEPLAFTALAVLVAATVVLLLKGASSHSCPWDLAQFGGRARWFPLLDPPPPDAGPGRCWPGGHASGGFAWVAAYFALRGRARRGARAALALALLLGSAMSAVQVARGAHLASHNLWTLWWCWAVALLLCAFRPRGDRVRRGAGQAGR